MSPLSRDFTRGGWRPHRGLDAGARVRGVLFQVTEFIPLAA